MANPQLSNALQNPPFKTPVADDSGFMSDPWSKWIRQVFQRIGGNVALPNTEIQTAVSLTQSQAVSVTTLQTTVDALLVSTSGIGVGPVL